MKNKGNYNKVYVCLDKEKLYIYGCFTSKEKAEKFVNQSSKIAIKELEVK